MYPIRINKKMLIMKIHYVLYLGGIASVQGFAPTIAKQLGYSPIVVGAIYTFLSILAFVVKPISGMIVDKFPVKRIMFLTVILSCSFTAFSLNLVEKLPTENVIDLSCDTTTVLNVCSNVDDKLPQCDRSLLKHININVKPVTCQLICQPNTLFRNEMCNSWNIYEYCTSNNSLDYLNVTLFINLTNQAEDHYTFEVKSIQMKETQVLLPICETPVNTRCEIKCSNDAVMELATAPKIIGCIFSLRQFWEFFIIISLYWISQAIAWNLQDPICFDLLGDKPGDFGKQRCWGSISWGSFSLFGGVLVDYFSDNNLHKNYTPIYFLSFVILICDFMVAYKIKIPETNGSKRMFTDIFKLLKKLNVIVYFLWIIVLGMCTSLPWNYLLWYMEDITMIYHNDKQARIKTLQGLAVGVQTIVGEVPFLFFSGYIIKRIGHWYCMTLGLFVFAIRFYLYSIITNPVWILPVEIANGITYGLGHATLLAYARIIAPPNSVTTVTGFAGALFEGVGASFGSVLGGIFYDKYGGVLTFQIFSFGSLLMCILHILYIKFIKSHEYNITYLN